MYAIAFVIWTVWVRPEPWRGRSEAIRYCPLPFWIAEHDDAGKGVALEWAIAPPTVTASTTIATPTDAPTPA
jgi:hypothetical protein